MISPLNLKPPQRLKLPLKQRLKLLLNSRRKKGHNYLIAFVFLAISQITYASSYVLQWTNPNNGYRLCEATVTKSCGLRIVIWELINGQWVLVATPIFRAVSYTMPVFPTAGKHTYGLWATYKNNTGTVTHTNMYQNTLTVPAH